MSDRRLTRAEWKRMVRLYQELRRVNYLAPEDYPRWLLRAAVADVEHFLVWATKHELESGVGENVKKVAAKNAENGKAPEIGGNAKKKGLPARCDCGRPAVKIKHKEGICERCDRLEQGNRLEEAKRARAPQIERLKEGRLMWEPA